MLLPQPAFPISLTLLSCCLFAPALFAQQVAFSPNDETIAIGGEYGEIQLVDSATAKLKFEMLHPGVPKLDPDQPLSAINWTASVWFSPDGKRLASSCGLTPVAIWDLETRKVIHTLQQASVGYNLAFSPDGSRLVGIGVEGKIGPTRIALWDTQTGKVLSTCTTDQIETKNSGKLFSTNGLKIAFTCQQAGKRFFYILDTVSGEQKLKLELSSYQHAYLSPDGLRSLVSDFSEEKHSYKIIDTLNGKSILTPPKQDR